MKTRITELLKIEHPIVCPGMTYVANSTLVAATSNAGGLGILAIGHLTPDETREEIRRVKSLTTKPFGIGCALMMPGAWDNLEIALQEQVPVINFSLGNGSEVCKRVHAYGGKVIATVVNAKHALGAEKAGVDALLVTGHEAAAHGGSVTSLVLVPAIRQITQLPIIAAGGFSSGSALVAALSLGADAVAMGTRWAATQESPVHDNTKQAIVAKDVFSTIYSANFDTLPCRVMDTPHARAVTKKRLSLGRALVRALKAARDNGKSLVSIVRMAFQQGLKDTLTLTFFGAAVGSIRRATIDGNLNNGVQLIGQAQGLVHDIPTVQALTDRIMEEARASCMSLARFAD
ncbi:MAG TPA: nitronate monooxygenase [Limnobacter sp.]|uniref:NAD(P)H-dependent flavin oxidoreductase n=1 Tax=Limnobacter sp. TaxID=2003368 RepID=UPI002ED9EBDB